MAFTLRGRWVGVQGGAPASNGKLGLLLGAVGFIVITC